MQYHAERLEVSNSSLLLEYGRMYTAVSLKLVNVQSLTVIV